MARGHGETQRRAAISAFSQAHGANHHGAKAGVATSVTSANARPVANDRDDSRSATLPDQRTWSPKRIHDHAASIAVASTEQTSALALLRIPRIGLEVPVFSDTGEHNLNRGAGWVRGTAAPGSDGNVAIAAHRDGYFRALKNVAVGDVLELDSPTQRRRYRVSALTIVDPSDVSPLADTQSNAVTLVTCYPFYFVGSAPKRYIVRAVAER